MTNQERHKYALSLIGTNYSSSLYHSPEEFSSAREIMAKIVEKKLKGPSKSTMYKDIPGADSDTDFSYVYAMREEMELSRRFLLDIVKYGVPLWSSNTCFNDECEEYCPFGDLHIEKNKAGFCKKQKFTIGNMDYCAGQIYIRRLEEQLGYKDKRDYDNFVISARSFRNYTDIYPNYDKTL